MPYRVWDVDQERGVNPSDQLDPTQHATDHSSGDQTGTDETQIDDNAHGSDGKTDPLDQTRGRSLPDTP